MSFTRKQHGVGAVHEGRQARLNLLQAERQALQGDCQGALFRLAEGLRQKGLAALHYIESRDYDLKSSHKLASKRHQQASDAERLALSAFSKHCLVRR